MKDYYERGTYKPTTNEKVHTVSMTIHMLQSLHMYVPTYINRYGGTQLNDEE